MDYNKIIALVKEAAQMVFDESLRQEVHTKGAADFVTAVDLRISSFLKEQLALLAPEVAFMSEEEDFCYADQIWILDPIDGTTNLVYDYNMSSVSLALCRKGIIEWGVIYNPFNGDLFTAKRGEGAYYNGRKLQQAPDRELKDCLIEFGLPAPCPFSRSALAATVCFSNNSRASACKKLAALVSVSFICCYCSLFVNALIIGLAFCLLNSISYIASTIGMATCMRSFVLCMACVP